ncbi:MAG: EF-P beta-lysylation protein EpmB [Gammaproteobacteria bacterium]
MVQLVPLDPDKDWRVELARAPTSIGELRYLLKLPKALGDDNSHADFPLRVPLSYIRRIEAGNPSDPLLLQILPQAQEAVQNGSPWGQLDPLREQLQQPVQGVISKYAGRVLWMLSGACPIHCRYCFRRHLPYSEMTASIRGADQVLDWLADNPQVTEVIFSGGDPLSLPDRVLSPLVERLAAIDHIRTLRIHTRFPVVIPQRVNQELIDWVARCKKQFDHGLVMVLHLNHAQEIDEDFAQAIQLLRQAGVRLYAQSVLLAGVNDSSDSLSQLFERMWQLEIQPYYLHLLDPVQGTRHFDLPQWRAQLLYGEVCSRLPGYLIPKLVRETPGLPSKTLIPPSFATHTSC